ncbi:MAG: hypothetical protein WAV48_05010 [Candidatus Magasanikiibacteriota bacterium]
MKILNVYYGTDAYSFESEPFHAHCRYSCDEEHITLHIGRAKEHLQMGKCFWYLVNVCDVNPHTGAVEVRNYYDSVEEKQKIILNARAKQGLSTAKETAPTILKWDWNNPKPPLAEEAL